MLTSQKQLDLIDEKVKTCTFCEELAVVRNKTVFGKGNPNADILFLGEAPGRDEDEQGIPFVGKSGRLLNNIIKGVNWNVDDVYICNIVKCRPPGNRNPKNDEASNCRGFLDLQIKVIDPKYIICLGKVASFYLLDVASTGRTMSQFTIGPYRKIIHTSGKYKVLCTYHPSFLLRNPSAKKEVWEDLMFFKEYMEKEIDAVH